MILECLRLKNFGKFSTAEFTFKPGLNLVLGLNEAGKSTLMEAIPAVFFGSRNKERYQNWRSRGDCRVKAVFRNEAERLSVERNMLSDHVCLIEEDGLQKVLYQFEGKVAPLGRSAEKVEYVDRIARILGMAEEDIFRASLFYGQGNLRVSNRQDLGAKMKNLLSGSVEVDYEKVLNSLQEDYFAVTRKNSWGRDKTNDRELETVKLKLVELNKTRLESLDSMEKLESLQARIESLKAELEKDREAFFRGDRALAWMKKRLALEEKERTLQEEFRRLQKEERKIERLKGERESLLEAMRGMRLPEELTEDLPRLIYELRQLRERIVGAEKKISGLYQAMPQSVETPWAVLFGGCLLMVSAVVFQIRNNPQWLVPGGMGAGLAVSLLFLFLLRKNNLRNNERRLVKGQAAILEAGLEETRKSLLDLETYLEELGLKHSAEELHGLKNLFQQRTRYQERLRGIESALEVLESPAELRELKENLIRELAVVDEKKGGIATDGFRDKMIDLPEAELRLVALREKMNDEELELSNLEQQASFLAGRLGNVTGIEEEEECLQGKERLLNERKEILLLAHDLLAEAVEDFRRGYLESFAGEVDHTLGLLVGNGDRNLHVADDFAFRLKENDGDWLPLDHFSQGTTDAVFFAVRLVLARQLFHNQRLPLFLDDPLVNFDSKRLINTLQYLETLDSRHQVLLFSHDNRLLNLIDRSKWNVFSLPG